MLVIPLQSGSTGNSVYVEARGVRLLFDAGISGKQAAARLAAAGRDIRAVDALLVSHDHADHARCMGIYHRKFGLPVYASRGTARAVRCARYPVGEISELQEHEPGATLCFGPVRVETVPTPHDGTDGVGFVVSDGEHRLGILTDLGHVFDGLAGVVRSLDAVVLESNYDPDMLARGSYPEWLKARIAGSAGHISNHEAAGLLDAASGRLRWACLAHLSEENNTPDLALHTLRARLGDSLPLHVASRTHAIGPLVL